MLAAQRVGGGPRISRLHVTVVESPFVAFGNESLQWIHVFVYVFSEKGSSWHRCWVAEETASALMGPPVQCIRAGESCSSSVHPCHRKSSWGG